MTTPPEPPALELLLSRPVEFAVLALDDLMLRCDGCERELMGTAVVTPLLQNVYCVDCAFQQVNR